MADYKVTDSEMTTVANAIRTKGGTSAQLEWPSGFANAVAAIPSGGGSSPLFWAPAGYSGDVSGTATGELTLSIAGKIGNIAVLVVMHRSSVTTPSGWEFIDNRTNPNSDQQISIFKKTLAVDNESVIVQQSNSSARMCMCAFVFSRDPNLSFIASQEMDADSSTYRYTIEKRLTPTFVVMSNPYTTTYPSRTMEPDQLYAYNHGASSPYYQMFNTGLQKGNGYRLMCAINNAPNDFVFGESTPAGTDDRAHNRVHIYAING